ncbi:MAG: hypothetical protein LPK85_14445 [Gammaproteobacteria bacterium]|nr:hypothetical protein [Gammaproteobacteria bacterium]
MQLPDDALTNHEVTICLDGGAVLGPFHASWSAEQASDIRDLLREYDQFLQGEPQRRYRFHLHDTYTNAVHTLVLDFDHVTGIYDHVRLRASAC